MQITKLKVNNFGSISNKEFEFKSGINVVIGRNESGKSTLIQFICSMFYGTSKNKNSREISNYDKYLPWKSAENDFSGTIEYELDNKESFKVFRIFNKKNPQVFNSASEDITKQFNIDKNKGNEFFYEQTNIDEGLFLNTALSYQEEMRLNKSEQNNLIR